MSVLEPVPFSRRKPDEPRVSPARVPGIPNSRFWSEEEKQVLRDFYEKEGAQGCLARLPRCNSVRQIYSQANALGLKKPAKRSPARARHVFTNELDEKIRQEWVLLPNAKGAVQALADRLGLERWVLSKRAVKLGLALPYKKEPRWTAAEEELLAKSPLHDPVKCARIFREHGFQRTPASITVHATRRSLSRRFIGGMSARAAAEILGVDSKWITSRIFDGVLAADRRGSKRVNQQGGDAWAISPESLRRFVIENIETIDIRKVEKFSFVQLLTASEMDVPAGALS